MSIKKQQGFTAIELALAIGMIGSLAIIGGLIYAGLHFMSKFW